MPGLGRAFLGHYRLGAMFTIAIVIAMAMVKASVFFAARMAASGAPDHSDRRYGCSGYCDLVVFKLPCQYQLLDRANAKAFEARCDRSVDFVERIAGSPGDTVQLKQGVVFVNDIPLLRETAGSFTYATFRDEASKPYRRAIETTPDGARCTIIQTLRGEPTLDNTEPVVVPLDSYFVLGDNRDESADSRDPVSGVGNVPRDCLIGKAALIYFSISRSSSAGCSGSFFPAIRWDPIGMPLS